MIQVGDLLRVFAKGVNSYALAKDEEYVGELAPKALRLGDVVEVDQQLFIVHSILEKPGEQTLISLEKGFVPLSHVQRRWAKI